MDTRTYLDSDWLKANVNVKDGDHVKILNEGKEEPRQGKPGEVQLVLDVAVLRDNVEVARKKLGLNVGNHKAIIALHGYESKKWVGKEFRVNVVKKQNPSGQLVDAIVLSAPNTDEEGDAIIT